MSLFAEIPLQCVRSVTPQALALVSAHLVLSCPHINPSIYSRSLPHSLALYVTGKVRSGGSSEYTALLRKEEKMRLGEGEGEA